MSLDEGGASAAMTRRYGRAPRRRRVDAAAPHGYRKGVTPTAAVRAGGVGACLAFDGATNAACFEAHVGRRPAPTLRPGDIVVMGDPSCHGTAEVERLIRTVGAEARYLPAYSPDPNPIEMVFGKLEESLRSAAARSIDALIEAMGDALRAARPSDILGWFKHPGYRYVQ